MNDKMEAVIMVLKKHQTTLHRLPWKQADIERIAEELIAAVKLSTEDDADELKEIAEGENETKR